MSFWYIQAMVKCFERKEGRCLSKTQNAPIVAMYQINQKKWIMTVAITSIHAPLLAVGRYLCIRICTSSTLVRKSSLCSPCEALQHESRGPVDNLSHGPWDKGHRSAARHRFLSKDHVRYAFQNFIFLHQHWAKVFPKKNGVDINKDNKQECFLAPAGKVINRSGHPRCATAPKHGSKSSSPNPTVASDDVARWRDLHCSSGADS